MPFFSILYNIRMEKFFMSFHKTPQRERHAIRYQFEDGEGRKEPQICITPGRNGVTEADLRNFYSAEDSEVYHNIRSVDPDAWLNEAEKQALRNKKQAWAQKYAAEFAAAYGYTLDPTAVRDAVNEEFPKKRTVSLEELTDLEGNSDAKDKSAILQKLAVPLLPEVPPDVERLRELVDTFPPRWQVIYRRVLLDKESKVAVGADLGISDVRVGQIVRQIRQKIENDEILKKIFS